MKNITLSIDETLLHEARKYAVERRTTVNALVREYLQGLVQQRDRIRAAVERLEELSGDSDLEIGAITWTRDDLHER